MLDEEWWGPLVLELLCDGDPWLQSGSYVGLCWELGSRPPGGGLPSACLRSSSSPNCARASASVVTFGARNPDCTVIMVGPTARGKPGLLRGPEVSPGLFLVVPGAGWSVLVL